MSTSTRTPIETTTNDFYTTILACTGSAAGIQNWASVIENGALKLDQVEGAFIASPEARQVVVRIVELGPGTGRRLGGSRGTLSLVQIATDNQLRRSPFSDDSGYRATPAAGTHCTSSRRSQNRRHRFMQVTHNHPRVIETMRGASQKM